jgi:hypothetical protein
MAEFRTTFPVAASAETVWGILLDFERWSEWNPSVPSISGDARLSGTVALTLAMPRRPSAKVKATITKLVPERRFCWHGTVGSERIFAGTREFVIDPRPDGTVLVTHVEDISGLLFPVFRAVMGSAIQEHHDNLNAALKDRAETRTTP